MCSKVRKERRKGERREGGMKEKVEGRGRTKEKKENAKLNSKKEKCVIYLQ